MNNLNIISITLNTAKKQSFVNAYLKKANLTRILKLQYLDGLKRFEYNVETTNASHPIKNMNDDYQNVKSWINFNLSL